VAGLLVVLIGAQVAVLLTTDDAALPVPTAPVAAPVRNVVDVPSILRANLFGEARARSDGSNAPATSLAMVLTGIISTSDPGSGYAFIGPSSTAVKLYIVGATLSGGARLHAVYSDRVLLDRGGTLESLMLQKRAPGTGPPPPLPVQAGANVERMQQLVRENPGIVGEIMRPQAVLADGRQRGYRVYPGPNAQAFSRLGLRPGDLVTAINGTTLDDPSRGGEIFGTLGSVAEARVTIVRNGSQQELLLNLAEVANEAEKLSQTPAVPAPAPNTGQPAVPAAAR
jgi:general secretion pathway protein C